MTPIPRATFTRSLRAAPQSGPAPFLAIQGTGCAGIPGVNAGAAIGPNGAIYFADQDAQVYSLTDNGSGTSPTLNWGPVQPTGDCNHFVTTGAPTLSNDGSTLYILVSDGKLYALSTSTGILKWSVGNRHGRFDRHHRAGGRPRRQHLRSFQ